jgi:hypothetical protein
LGTGVGGRIILKCIFMMWDGQAGMDWIDLAQNMDRCHALVNAVMNFGFHKMRGISLQAENMLASQGLCSMEFGWLVGRFIGKRTAQLKGLNP